MGILVGFLRLFFKVVGEIIVMLWLQFGLAIFAVAATLTNAYWMILECNLIYLSKSSLHATWTNMNGTIEMYVKLAVLAVYALVVLQTILIQATSRITAFVFKKNDAVVAIDKDVERKFKAIDWYIHLSVAALVFGEYQLNKNGASFGRNHSALLTVPMFVLEMTAIMYVSWYVASTQIKYLLSVNVMAAFGVGSQTTRAAKGAALERETASLFQNAGWETHQVGGSGDFGADVLARNPQTGHSVAVQCKNYSGRVGVEAVQQVIGAREFYKTKEAHLVFRGRLTDAAARLAKAANVKVTKAGGAQITTGMTRKFLIGSKKVS